MAQKKEKKKRDCTKQKITKMEGEGDDTENK